MSTIVSRRSLWAPHQYGRPHAGHRSAVDSLAGHEVAPPLRAFLRLLQIPELFPAKKFDRTYWTVRSTRGLVLWPAHPGRVGGEVDLTLHTRINVGALWLDRPHRQHHHADHLVGDLLIPAHSDHAGGFD